MTVPTYGNGAQILSKSSPVCLSFLLLLYIVVLTYLLDDFFVGIGDINSTFLPKLEPLTAVTSPRPGSEVKDILQQGVPNPQNLPLPSKTDTPEAGTSMPLSTTIPITSPNEEVERAQLAANAMLKQNNLALEAQLEERPLAKKQEALQEGDAAAHEHARHNAENKPVTGVQSTHQETTHKHEKRKALLKNDDYELERVAKVRSYFSKVLRRLKLAPCQLLDQVHERFFSAYDGRPLEGARRKSLANREAIPYDVKVGTLEPYI